MSNQLITNLENIKNQKDTYLLPGNLKTGVTLLGVNGTFTSDADAVAADVLEDKTAYVNGVKVTGTMPNNGELEIVPTTSEQELDAGYISGGTVAAVTAAIDANIAPNNIKAGVTILGVEGNVQPDKPDQTKTVTPTTEEQEIYADTGYELGKVVVEAVTSDIDENIAAANIKSGVEILGVEGTFTADADAIATDIVSGKSAYVDGVKVEGSVTEVASGDAEFDFTNININMDNIEVVGILDDDKLIREGAGGVIAVPNADLATAIGLTANVLTEGTYILGVNGTAVAGTRTYASVAAMQADTSKPEGSIALVFAMSGDTAMYGGFYKYAKVGTATTATWNRLEEIDLNTEEYGDALDTANDILGETEEE